MITFKEFLKITEQNGLGLGNLGSQMQKAFDSIPSVLPNGFKRPDYLVGIPSLDVQLPTTTGNGTIQLMDTKKSPIYIKLSDGTDCYFTIDEFRRIHGKPALGKSMTVVFQRHPENRDENSSQIISARVF
jgi:hypothetical protein